MKVDYMRVSSFEQKFDRQELGELDKVFEKKISRSTSERLALKKMIDFARENDEAVRRISVYVMALKSVPQFVAT